MRDKIIAALPRSSWVAIVRAFAQHHVDNRQHNDKADQNASTHNTTPGYPADENGFA